MVTANYGTNAEAGPPTRPDSPPASSETILVSTTAYSSAGELENQTDPTGKVSRSEYDNLGRAVKTTNNFGSTPFEATEKSYTADGQLETLMAINSDTGNQITTYTYGVTLANSNPVNHQLSW